MFSPRVRALAVFAAAASLAAPAGADIIFGGSARSVAMGGAGIAIVDRYGRNINVNPASLALMNRRIRLGFPSIGVRMGGAMSFSTAAKYIANPPGESAATDLARDFARQDSDLSGNFDWGLRVGHAHISVSGVGVARLLPNDQAKLWARENAPPEALDTADPLHNPRYDGAEAHLLGAAAYTLPTFTVAERVSAPGAATQMEMGARIKITRGIYSHYIARQNQIAGGADADLAPEMNGNSTLEKTGLGVDYGFLIHPREQHGWSGAIIVTNLIEPNLTFDGTDRNNRAVRYDLQPRSISLGTAYEGAHRAVFAFDLVDITSAFGDPQARFGVEYRTRGIGLRGGYSSARGFTVGFGWGFLELAYGVRAPLEISQTLRF